jgi:hypothetical protein
LPPPLNIAVIKSFEIQKKKKNPKKKKSWQFSSTIPLIPRQQKKTQIFHCITENIVLNKIEITIYDEPLT